MFQAEPFTLSQRIRLHLLEVLDGLFPNQTYYQPALKSYPQLHDPVALSAISQHFQMSLAL
jgi:hypothetical protein